MGHPPSKRIGNRVKHARKTNATGWEPVAGWYDGWVGRRGSVYHRKIAIPTVLELLCLRAGERVLDLGCGSGVLAPHVLRAGAGYLGVDASGTLIARARGHHRGADFLQGDVRRLRALHGVAASGHEAAVFMLSLQDMNPLDEVLAAASWALAPGGRLVAFLLHPCFRVPRQSGWGYDEGRKLTYRRVDRYLSELRVPMKAYAEANAGPRGATMSFHRPLAAYVNTLAQQGLVVDHLREIADPLAGKNGRVQEQRDIPLFAALRAKKMP